MLLRGLEIVKQFHFIFVFSCLLAVSGCSGGGDDEQNGGGAGNGSGSGGTVNQAPTANAGVDQSVVSGSTVNLSGSASSDPDGNTITYSWSFTSKPTDSTATLSDTTNVAPTFTADLVGDYVVQLIVNDGTVDSPSDSVTISATAAASTSNLFKTEASIVRFLNRAAFGAKPGESATLLNTDVSNWFKDQFSIAHTPYVPIMRAEQATFNDEDQIEGVRINQMFGDRAIKNQDQLRQRMVFALSEIIVASNVSSMDSYPIVMGRYVDILSENAFGNYRQLLDDITYSAAMGLYLTYFGNDKGNPGTGSLPDENYAREVMQLFSIGLVQLNMDGSAKLDANGQTIPTYGKADIVGLSRVFTGLSVPTPDLTEGWGNPDQGGKDGNGCFISASCDNYHHPMVVYPEHHSALEKTFLGTTIPANTSGEESIRIALDTIFNHPNVAPFISKQLIQRFVTSNPKPAYVERVANVFVNGVYTLPDGTVVGEAKRGDLKATLAAILLDQDAVREPSAVPAEFGKIREPYIRFINWVRAFNALKLDMQKVWLDDVRFGFRQTPFKGPSVFNFFRPGYTPANTLSSNAGLSVPEMQIADESSVVDYINLMNAYIYENRHGTFFDTNGDEIIAIDPEYQTQISLSEDADALVENLNLLLTGNQLSAETISQMKDILNDIPVVSSGTQGDFEKRLRVHAAISMVMTAPGFLVQR